MGETLPESAQGRKEIEIRQVFAPDDFGLAITPELKAAEVLAETGGPERIFVTGLACTRQSKMV